MHWLWALAMLLGPLAAGAGLGRAAAAMTSPGARRGLLAALWLGPLGLAWVLAPAVPTVSAWDLLLSAALLSLGAWLGWAHRRAGAGGREVGLLAGAVMVALLAAEIGARLLLPAPPSYPDPAEARLAFPEQAAGEEGPPAELARGRPWRCEALYPERYPGYLQVRAGRAEAGGRMVLHVGDSMVEALGVDEPFPALLDRPGERHVNAGVSTTGPDYQYLLIREWTEVLAVDRVVQHLYTGNDLEDVGYPYFCCGGESLLDLGESPPRWRCPEPRRALDTPALLGAHAPPYPIRVATGVSSLARHAARAFEQVGRALATSRGVGQVTGEAYAEALARLDPIIGATAALLRERGIEYVLVVLPSLRDLSGDPEDREHGERVIRDFLAVGRRYGITTLDATPVLASALREHGPAHLYILGPDGADHHFDPEGHRLYADWLRRHLP